VAKGTNYGGSDAADWTNNWGTYWNRIMESAAWEPGGDLSASDVFSGKTFYGGSNDRDVQTGTWDQSLVEFDDYKDDGSAEDSASEESSWTNTAGNETTGVWRDNRTGLYWSASQGQMSNIFPDDDSDSETPTCDFFNESLYPARRDYSCSGPDCDSDCGNAINACAQLSLEAVTGQGVQIDWYLPSQKELLQAYLDGIYNQTNATFATFNRFWSSTEFSDISGYAWDVNSAYGLTNITAKTTGTRYVRCVRRD
jgi:hypothetical protein